MIPAALLHRKRLGKFISVGAVGAIIDLSISTSLLFQTDLPPELIKLIGAEVAIVVMFFLNDRWTFQQSETRGIRQTAKRLIKSNVVRSGGLTVQVSVVFVLIRLPISVQVVGTDLWPLMTMPIAIACGFVVNYTGETLFTWRVTQ